MSKEAHVNLLPKQLEILSCEAPRILATGGIGSSKTFTGVHWIIKMVTEYPDAQGLICANTYRQLTNSTMAALIKELKNLGLRDGIDFTYTVGQKIKIYGTTILLYSLENYETMKGAQVQFIWADEIGFAKYEAYRELCDRLRGTEGPCQILLTTTTNGFNWLYDRFVTKANDDHVTFKMLTKDNPHNGPHYYPGLVEQYGGEHTPIARQQLFGEFVNLTSGQVYNYFDETKHLNPVSRSGSKLYIGIDFNVGNMNAVVCEADANSLRVIDEIVLNKGNEGTHEMAMEIKHRYGTGNIEIIPDATGKARKSSSSTTDHRILINHGFKLNAPSKNPFIADRQQELNHCFLMHKIDINPKCKNLVSELHKLNHEDDEGNVAHISVALGYVVYRLKIAGLRAKRKPNRTIYI